MSLSANDLVFYRDKNSGTAYSCGYKINSEFLADKLPPIHTQNRNRTDDAETVRALYAGALAVPIGFLNMEPSDSEGVVVSEAREEGCVPTSLYDSLLALSCVAPTVSKSRTRKNRQAPVRRAKTRCCKHI